MVYQAFASPTRRNPNNSNSGKKLNPKLPLWGSDDDDVELSVVSESVVSESGVSESEVSWSGD